MAGDPQYSWEVSRTLRLGLAVLTLLLLVMLLVRGYIQYFVPPPTVDQDLQARMNKAYAEWQAAHKEADDAYAAASLTSGTQGELFPFDPNTLDSAGFIRLGFPPRAVKGLLKWRKFKVFYKAEDLKPLYNLPTEVYERVAPYVTINTPARPEKSFGNSFPEIPSIIDLNTADSATLDRGLPGIGATLSHKIVEHRRALGGFIKPEQILEVYRLPDSTFQRIKAKVVVSSNGLRRMGLNTASMTQLSAHPYIGEKLARHILMYREGIKHYESVEQLRQVPLMNEEIYRKIAPYFSLE